MGFFFFSSRGNTLPSWRFYFYLLHNWGDKNTLYRVTPPQPHPHTTAYIETKRTWHRITVTCRHDINESTVDQFDIER